MNDVISWVTQNWVTLVAALWLIEQTLRAISILTPWKWDDNLVAILANILKAFFPKKVT